MEDDPAPTRVMLKLSGGVFAGHQDAPFGEESLSYIASELAEAHRHCSQIAVVVGGGNVIRGASFQPTGPGRISADYAGMLATVMNALLLRDRLRQVGVSASHYCAFPIVRIAPVFEPEPAVRDLQDGRIVILAGGTGNPLVTTDTAAAIRAVEVEAEVLLKATRVDGVYTADPEQDPGARIFERLSYGEVLERELGFMDLAAISLCRQHRLPLRVFNYAEPGNILRAVRAGADRTQSIGTLIGSNCDAR